MADFVKQIKTQANKVVIKIKTLPATVKKLSTERQIAYGSIVLGVFFILLAIILW